MTTGVIQRPPLPSLHPHPQPPTLPLHLSASCILHLPPIQSHTWLDHSGKGNNATNHGATPTASGRHGFAWKFDGVSAYMDCGDDASTKPNTVTTTAWVKRADTESNDQYIIDRNSPLDRGYGYTLTIENNKLYWRLRDLDSGWYINIYTPFSDTNWHHIIGVYDSNGAFLYVDSAQKANDSYKGAIAYIPNPLRIGIMSYADIGHFNGLIDEVLIFNSALSASDVQALYEMTKP